MGKCLTALLKRDIFRNSLSKEGFGDENVARFAVVVLIVFGEAQCFFRVFTDRDFAEVFKERAVVFVVFSGSPFFFSWPACETFHPVCPLTCRLSQKSI